MNQIYMYNVDCSILIFIHVLLLPEREMGKAWELSKSNAFLDIGGGGAFTWQKSSSLSLQRVEIKAECPHNVVHNYVQNSFHFWCRILSNLKIWVACTLNDPTGCDCFLRDKD